MKKLLILLFILPFVCTTAFGTVNTETTDATGTGDGSDTTFDFDFGIFNTSDIVVQVVTTATGAAVTQTETTHYAVSATNNNYWSGPGGTVTFVTAPTSAQTVYMYRDPAFTQTYNLNALSSFRSASTTSMENTLDKLTTQVQYLQLQMDRAIKMQPNEKGLTAQLPNKVDSAGEYLMRDASGNITTAAGTADATAHSSVGVELASASSRAVAAAAAGAPSVFNVTSADYGATVDAAGDDLAAIQAAFDAAAAAGGGMVLLPPGDYTTTARINMYSATAAIADVSIWGYGATITSAATDDIVRIGESGGSYAVMNCGIHGLTLYSTTAITGIHLTGSSVSHNYFRDVKIYGDSTTYSCGIYLFPTGTGCHFNTFSSMWITDWDTGISNGYNFATTTGVSNTNSANANYFYGISVPYFIEHGLYLHECAGGRFEVDVQGAQTGALTDITLSSSSSNNHIVIRHESGIGSTTDDGIVIASGCASNVIIGHGFTSGLTDNNTGNENIILGHWDGNCKAYFEHIETDQINLNSDKPINIGDSAVWVWEYDDGADDQMLLASSKTSTAATTDPMFEILVDTGDANGTGMTAQQQVFGVAKGTQASNVALMTLDEDGDLGINGSFTTGGFFDTSADIYAGKNLAFDGTPQSLSGAGEINSSTAITEFTSTGANALTIANGADQGQIKMIVHISDGGAGTLAGANLADGAGSSVVFTDDGDACTLVWTNGNWYVIGGNELFTP